MNQTVHYHIHKITSLVPILGQMNPIYKFSNCFSNTHYNIFLPSTPRSSTWSCTFTFFNQNAVCIHHHNAHYMPHPSHPPYFDHSNNIWWNVQVTKLLISQPPPGSRHFLPLCSNILLNNFSHILNLCSSRRMRDAVSQAFRTVGEITLFYVLISTFLDRRWEDKRLRIERWQAFLEFNLLVMSSWMQFWFVAVVPKYLNFVTFMKDSLARVNLWFFPSFWWWDIQINLIFSAFTSRSASLRDYNRDSVPLF